MNVTVGKGRTSIKSVSLPTQPLPSVKVYVKICNPKPAAAGSKVKLVPLPSSVTPGPIYSPPPGVPPVITCVPSVIQKVF